MNISEFLLCKCLKITFRDRRNRQKVKKYLYMKVIRNWLKHFDETVLSYAICVVKFTVAKYRRLLTSAPLCSIE